MDNLEVVITQEDLEIVFNQDTELVFVDDGLEFIVNTDVEIIIQDDVIELLTDSEPGIPAGGMVNQVLAKRTSTSFDVEWVPQTKITVGTIPPSSPAIGDLWVDTN